MIVDKKLLSIAFPTAVQPKFFFETLSSDHFSYRNWCLGQIMYTFRGCESHDFSPVSQHFRGEKKRKFLFFLKGKNISKGRIVKERIQISYSTQGSRRRKVLKEEKKMLPVEDQMSEVVVLDVLKSSGCVFIHFLCWNKNEKGNSRGWYASKRVDDVGGRGPTCLMLSWVRSDWGAPEAPFFLFLSGKGVIEGLRSPDFFFDCVLHFHVQSYSRPTLWVHDRFYWSKTSDLVSSLWVHDRFYWSETSDLVS